MQRLIRIILILVLFLSSGIEPVRNGNFEGSKFAFVTRCESHQVHFSSPLTMDKLMDVYDWIGSSFVLSIPVDLPGEFEIQKKWLDLSGRRAYQTLIDLLEKTNCSRRVEVCLFERHIQGFYIYVLNKLLI